MRFKFGKSNKLKHKTTIDQLFKEGASVTVFPLRLVYLKLDNKTETKVGVSVSKRLHKKAVTRNRIKRLIRECYRLNRPKYFNNSSTAYAFMILYISKDGTSFEELNHTMQTLFQKFLKNSSK